MPLHVDLRKRNTNTKVSLPLVEGILADFVAFPNGSGTLTEHERTWTYTKGDTDGKIYIELQGTGSDGSFSPELFFNQTLPSLEIPLTQPGQDIDDYLEVGTVYDLIPDSQSDQQTYPRYLISTTYTASSGRLRDIYTTNLRLEVQSQSSYDWQAFTSTSGETQVKFVMPCVLKNALGQYCFGNYGYQHEYWTSGYIDKFRIEWTASVRDNNWEETDLDPGGKGFRPTGSRTNKDIPGTGGRPPGGHKIPPYSGDQITQPGEPVETSASAVGSGLIRAYCIEAAQLANVAKCLYSSTILTAIQGLFVNPLDSIVALNILPYTPYTGTSEAVKLLNHTCVVNDLGVNASAPPISKQFRTVDFGTISIDENWGNFLDYSQTHIELYLPFIGSVELDTEECMNGTINVQYTIDFFTGMCVANVLCEKSFPAPSGLNLTSTSQHSYQGNCAIQIPLTAVDYGSMIGSMIGACATGLSNPAGGGVQVLTDITGGAWKPKVTTKGAISANAGYCSVTYPYIRITRPITAEPDSYQDVMGYPSYINTTLGECEDLCVCDDIDLRTITGATPSELARIRSFCQQGVHV